MADDTLQRLQELQSATKEYVDQEKRRLQAEADVLKKVLSGRTAGAGIQSTPIAEASRAAYASLSKYLKGEKLTLKGG